MILEPPSSALLRRMAPMNGAPTTVMTPVSTGCSFAEPARAACHRTPSSTVRHARQRNGRERSSFMRQSERDAEKSLTKTRRGLTQSERAHLMGGEGSAATPLGQHQEQELLRLQ